MNLYQWLLENCAEDDLVDGAFYNSQNRQWVIYDEILLLDFIAESSTDAQEG